MSSTRQAVTRLDSLTAAGRRPRRTPSHQCAAETGYTERITGRRTKPSCGKVPGAERGDLESVIFGVSELNEGSIPQASGAGGCQLASGNRQLANRSFRRGDSP
jgi:hypothetical protein